MSLMKIVFVLISISFVVVVNQLSSGREERLDRHRINVGGES